MNKPAQNDKSEQRHGIVKWFNAEKGFGFLEMHGGGDVFVHFSGIIMEDKYRALPDGARVKFNLIEGAKGPQAVDVVIINDKNEDR